MWNASYVQKHSNILQLHLTGMGRWRDPAKYQEAAIAIASAKWKIGSRPFPNDEYIQLSQIVPTCHRLEVLKFEFCLKSRFKTRHAGSWLSQLPLTKIGFDKSAGTSGWSAPISSQLMSSFVGSGLMSGPLPPAKLRSFTSLQMVHTHTLLPRGFLRLRLMRWRWKWKENGNEMTMKMRWQLLNRDTKRGTQKRLGKRENTNTNTPSPEWANPERVREKKKRTDDGPNTDQRRGGGQKRLTQPTRREPKPTSAREGPKRDLEREHAWDRGPMGNYSRWKNMMHPQSMQESW